MQARIDENKDGWRRLDDGELESVIESHQRFLRKTGG